MTSYTQLTFIAFQAMLIMTSIVRVGQSKFAAIPIDEDSQERIMNCIETLAKLQASASVKEIFLHDTKAAYAKMVATEEKKALEKKAKENKTTAVQADDLISFRQFSKKASTGDMDDVSEANRRRHFALLHRFCTQFEVDLSRATGAAEIKDDFISKLSRIVQLTGELVPR